MASSSPKSLSCRIYIDQPHHYPPPRPGQYIVTEGKRGFGSAYLIQAVRETRRRDPHAPRRFPMLVQRAELREALESRDFIVLRWYPRKRRSTIKP